MSCLMMLSGAPSEDAARYDGDQKWPWIEYRFTRPVNCARRRLAETPLSEFTSAEMAIFGG